MLGWFTHTMRDRRPDSPSGESGEVVDLKAGSGFVPLMRSDMIGDQGHSLRCSSRTYDCFVTFLKVSDISIPLLQLRSFPSAGSPPGSESLPKRFLKLTTLYGTRQQEIGVFQIAGDECDIRQQRGYEFESSESASVAKLHIYVDEVCSSGLTGHVTIDLREFIEENDSEIYLEYPLSASSARHGAAKLKVVVRCTFPVEHQHDDCLDMDLEAFLSDEFTQTYGRKSKPNSPINIKQWTSSPDMYSILCGTRNTGDTVMYSALVLPSGVSDVEALLPGRRIVEDDIIDARHSQKECLALRNEIDLPKINHLGLNAKPNQVVEGYVPRSSVLVTGQLAGQFRNKRDQMYMNLSNLQAAMFFAAGVVIHQRSRSMDSAAASLPSQACVTHASSSKSNSSLPWERYRSYCPDSDVELLTSAMAKSAAAVVKVGEEKVIRSPSPDCVSSSSDGNSGIESLESPSNKAKGSGQRHPQRHNDSFICRTCSMASSRLDLIDSDGSPTVPPNTKESKSLLPAPSSSSKMRAAFIIRNILGVLLIAAVSFFLGSHGRYSGANTEEITGDNKRLADIEHHACTRTSGSFKLKEGNEDGEPVNVENVKLLNGLQTRNSIQKAIKGSLTGQQQPHEERDENYSTVRQWLESDSNLRNCLESDSNLRIGSPSRECGKDDNQSRESFEYQKQGRLSQKMMSEPPREGEAVLQKVVSTHRQIGCLAHSRFISRKESIEHIPGGRAKNLDPPELLTLLGRKILKVTIRMSD